ncbi:ORF82 [Ranid herpesvirus 1]|uniref:ORF82 n=1 Tax=Ranid herpesvirus 1 TaxID=85655 RepID=Q9YQY6_9VIRU|nr:ORF82 [Ranid herpesvirus 1]AAD12279.1 ORF82 [Ranid herpesvirus 1]
MNCFCCLPCGVLVWIFFAGYSATLIALAYGRFDGYTCLDLDVQNLAVFKRGFYVGGLCWGCTTALAAARYMGAFLLARYALISRRGTAGLLPVSSDEGSSVRNKSVPSNPGDVAWVLAAMGTLTAYADVAHALHKLVTVNGYTATHIPMCWYLGLAYAAVGIAALFGALVFLAILLSLCAVSRARPHVGSADKHDVTKLLDEHE